MRTESGWVEGWRRLSPYLDPAIGIMAAAAALLALVNADIGAIDSRLEDPDVASAVATVVAAGALAWRRSRPATSYAVLVIGSVLVSLTGHYIGLLSVLLLFSLFSLAAHVERRRDGVIGLGVGVVCFVGLAVLDVPDLGTSVLLQSMALLMAAWALGEAMRSRRLFLREQVAAAVTEERLRIARDLHDVVAHSMSLIAVQAGVGAHVIRTDPEAAEKSLEVIAETSRNALEQTRSMLGMLRETTEDGTRPPTQGLDDLEALIDDVRRSGIAVRLVRSGPPVETDAAVSLTAYRIVQEALTNIIKHSSAGEAQVTVTGTETNLDIDVTDPGPARFNSAWRPGHGLLGLDERVRLVGGVLESGAQGDGFHVHATIPTGASR